MNHVPAATFMMGRSKMTAVDKAVAEQWPSHGVEEDYEVPAHRVDVTEFCIDTVPVTAVEYGACVAAGGCAGAQLRPDGGKVACNRASSSAPDQSAECIDHRQATRYCESIGMRLPTEPEWELAARGTDGRVYPWGTPTPERSKRFLVPPHTCSEEGAPAKDGCGVGRFPAGKSPYGVLDMAGIHAEWTSSRYCSYANPKDCAEGAFAVRSEPYDAFLSRVYARRPLPAAEVGTLLGFRCATGARG